MINEHLTFSRGRKLLLSYVCFISFLSSLIAIFVLVSSGPKILLAIISGASFFTGLIPFWALIGIDCCHYSTQYVGLEILWSIVLIPITVLDTFLAASIAHLNVAQPNSVSQDSYSLDAGSARSLSGILTVSIGSCSVLIALYGIILLVLSVYTSYNRSGADTRPGDILFANITSEQTPFITPLFITRLLGCREDDRDPNETPNFPFDHPICSVDQNLHLPGCTCTEKIPYRPTRPEEYRAIQQFLWMLRSETTCPEEMLSVNGPLSSLRARIYKRGRQRAVSVPVPYIRFPTPRERRRATFNIAFDVV